jgi:uncharacterized protein (UPF0147 family)
MPGRIDRDKAIARIQEQLDRIYEDTAVPEETTRAALSEVRAYIDGLMDTLTATPAAREVIYQRKRC